jgi:hypothetical protein
MRLFIVFAVVFLASCSTMRFDSDDESMIAESVLKSLYGDNASTGQSGKVGASLCINGKNPPPEFLTRFADLRPTAFPCSASHFDEKLGELVQRGTANPMISFSVTEIKLLSPTSATATGGYYEALLSSAGYSFKLSKINGKWVVQERVMDWIS